MSVKAPISVLLAVAALAAGCGGGGGGGGNGGGTPAPGGIDTNNQLYEAAFGICSSAPTSQLRNDYYLDSEEPEVIAKAVATSMSGGNPADEPNVEAGCLAGLEAYEG